MKLPTLGSLVKNEQRTKFKCYSDDILWYETSDFEYPITREEAKGGTWLPEEKAILHMRWIRKHIESLQQELNNQGVTSED